MRCDAETKATGDQSTESNRINQGYPQSYAGEEFGGVEWKVEVPERDEADRRTDAAAHLGKFLFWTVDTFKAARVRVVRTSPIPSVSVPSVPRLLDDPWRQSPSAHLGKFLFWI
jgi:hypothetical protein